MGWFKKTSTTIGSNEVWSKPDRPLNQRILQALVFGTKHIVCKSLWADCEKGLVTLWGEEVAQGSIIEGKLSIEYGKDGRVICTTKITPSSKKW